MTAYDPNEHQSEVEQYLGQYLNGSIRFIDAAPLPKSTREPPWRINVEVDDTVHSYVLKLDLRGSRHEFQVLQAMESIPIPTPRVYGWDSEGVALGVPCFFSGFIEGESLLRPMLAGEVWAERLYIDSVCALQAVTREQLTNAELQPDQGETAEDVLNKAYEFFKSQPHPLAEAAYEILIATMPTFPELRFSNGDLWLDNFIVRDQELIGIIDFENAGFSDPIFEFLLSFFVEPKLQERGIEQRYMDQAGYDADVLPWYHGLEYFDTWHWVKKLDEPFMHHTAESLEIDLKNWIDGV